MEVKIISLEVCSKKKKNGRDFIYLFSSAEGSALFKCRPRCNLVLKEFDLLGYQLSQ